MLAWTLEGYEKYLVDYGDSTLTVTFEYDGSNNLIFMGRAQAGLKKGKVGWQVKKFTYDINGNVLEIQWASGTGSFDKIWDDRFLYTYT